MRPISSRSSCRYAWNRDSSVGIATRYGLDDPRIESRCGRDFPHLSRLALRPTQPPIQSVPGLCRGQSSLPGRGVDHPPPSSAEVNERVKLCLYFPSGPSWPCCRVKCQGRPSELPFDLFTVPEHKLHESV
jgi:hypothetical protein